MPDWESLGIDFKEEVCIEVEIPEKRVLLSDYLDWHNVLNYRYADNSMCQGEWEKEMKEISNLSGKDLDRKIKKSWERIFNVSPFENDWRSRGKFV